MHVVCMAKRRTYSATSPIRHRMKMYRLVAGNVSPELAMEFADMVNVEWASGYGTYKDLWRRFKAMGIKIPPGLRGIVRSGLFRCYKMVHTDGRDALETCLRLYANKSGLPPEYIDAIRRFIENEIESEEASSSKT